MSILAWLGLAPREDGESGADGEVIRRIARELEVMEPRAARHLALFAFLLARVANVDQEIGAEETRAMASIVETVGKLPPARSALVVEIAKAENRTFGETRNFLAAREFRDLASEGEKQDLLHCLFAVAAAEHAISIPEEETIRQIAKELLVSNDEYLSIRSAYREHRSIHQRRG